MVTHNVGLDDLHHICDSDVAVPDAFGIHRHIRTMLALVEASALVGADSVFQSAEGQLCLESPLKFGCRCRIAAATGMSLGTLIAAYKDVL